MAIYHLSMQAIGRAGGRSATGAAAYRAAEYILDERTGIEHDYTRKQGVEHTELILPGGATLDRGLFWNQVELHHKRGDAVLVREVEVALPSELDANARKTLAVGYARELAERYQVAADVAIHAPSRKGDERNHHAHIMLSACAVAPDGTLGKKAVALDPIHCQRHRLPNVAERERARWAELANTELEKAGLSASRIDHRSLAEQGIERPPGRHLGPAVSGMVRNGRHSEVFQRMEEHASERLYQSRLLGELERQERQIERELIDTTGDLAAALREREAARVMAHSAQIGMADFRGQFERYMSKEREKADMLRAVEALKAEREQQQRLELGRREANALALARQRQERERAAQLEREQKVQKRAKGYDGPEHSR
ncbi:MAG: MobA/MobL family protein [Pseudomonadota bacterium]